MAFKAEARYIAIVSVIGEVQQEPPGSLFLLQGGDVKEGA
jgi:hypothetical protein